MNQIRQNPFVFDGPVVGQKFIGRKTEVSMVLDRIGSPDRGSVAVIGERRIGKTSLLHYVSSPNVMAHWNRDIESSALIYLDCGTISPATSTRFWQVMLRGLSRELRRMGNRPALLNEVDTLRARSQIDSIDIGYLLDDLHIEDILLILLLDEFEWMIRTDPESEPETRDFLGGLRALVNRVPRAMSIVIATREPLDVLCQNINMMGSPFYNSFVYLHLRPFSWDESNRLVDQMLENTTVTFTERERSFIFEIAGNHPLLIQAAAYCMFNAKSGASPGVDVDLGALLDQYARLVEHQFKDLWRWSQPRERLIILASALGEKVASDWISKWRAETRTLELRGLLAEDRPGSFRLFSDVLSRWIQDNAYSLVDDSFRRWISDNGFDAWLRDHGFTALKSDDPRSNPQADISEDPGVIFISYSHKDVEIKDAVRKHLSVLEYASGLVEEVWSDDDIRAGEDWLERINDTMTRAKVALLLISADYLASEFVNTTELPRLLTRRENEGLLVIPIIVRPCAWRQVPWLRRMQIRPRGGQPLWRDAGKYADDDMTAVVEEIAKVLDKTQ